MFNEKDCNFCHPSFLFQTHISGALFEKYSSSINFYYVREIDQLINEQLTQENVRFREINFIAEDCEYLKREYAEDEYEGKIGHLSEYYKFNRDVPRCFDKSIVSTIFKYRDRLRELDFRKVKAALKREQGISLTSQHNQSSLPQSDEEIRSRYSTVLQELDEDSKNQSNILNNICQKIGQALKQVKTDATFKGNFNEGHRKFEEFMQKEDKKIKPFNNFGKRAPRNTFIHSNHPSRDQSQRNKENIMKNGLNFLKAKSKKKSMQKTTANQTISREERSKRMQKYLPKALDLDKHEQVFRPMTTAILTLKGKVNPTKTIDQIYRSSFNYDKYQSTKSKKTVIEGRKSKSKLPRQSSRSIKNHPNHKELKEEKYIIETDRMHRDESKKSVRKSTGLKRISQGKTRQPSMESHKILPLAKQMLYKLKMPDREHTLSKSKSKAQLSKQYSRQSLKIKNPTFKSISKLEQTSHSHKNSTMPRTQQHTMTSINRLLNKKLALFNKG